MGSSVPLPELVGALVDDLADRLRRLGTRHWREPLGPAGETLGDLVHALVRTCAARADELSADRPSGAPETPDRPAYDAALADRLAVTGRDLALALAHAGDERDAVAVLGGLLLAAKDLRLPRDAALVRLVWTRVAPAAGPVPSGDVDDLLARLGRHRPLLRELRPG